MEAAKDFDNFLARQGIWVNSTAATEQKDMPPACRMVHYQISHFQVGQGASGITPASSVVSLVAPLESSEYGTNNLVSVGVEQNSLWQNENLMVDSGQIFGRIETQGTLGNKLISLWLLDEETANNTVIDEAGLFVRNPYIKTSGTSYNVKSPEPVVGQPSPGVETYVDGYAPGRLLAAYKQFNPIRKEAYFSLLFRWSIDFG